MGLEFKIRFNPVLLWSIDKTSPRIGGLSVCNMRQLPRARFLSHPPKLGGGRPQTTSAWRMRRTCRCLETSVPHIHECKSCIIFSRGALTCSVLRNNPLSSVVRLHSGIFFHVSPPKRITAGPQLPRLSPVENPYPSKPSPSSC